MRMSVRDRNTWMRSAAGMAAALLIGAGSAAAAPGESGSPSATTSGSSAFRVDVATAAAAAATASEPDQQAPAPPQPPPPPEAPPPPPPPPPPPTFLQSIQVTGLVDVYYNWNFNQSSPEALRNFDITHNSFSLNYAEVAVAKAPTELSRAGFRMDFGAGDTANLVNAFEPGGTDFLKYVQQAYVSFLAPAGKGLTIDFGKFVTPAGAEVIESKDNFNYSRGLLFALAIPYYHAGARIGYSFNDKVSLTGFLVNGWNDVKDNNKDKTVGASLTVKPTGKTTLIANYLVGNEQADDAEGSGTRNLIDLVATYTATDKVSVLGNFDYGKDKVAGDGVDWYGVAFGLKFQATPTFAFSPRYEVFKDADGFATGQAQTLQEITLTGEYKIPAGFIARFEFRNDFSDEHFFANDHDVLKKTQPTFAIGLIYAFDSKQ